jgi:hypothetical protein
MRTPRFPDQQEDSPPARPVNWKTKTAIAVIVAAFVVMIVLHIAHVVGP